MSSIESLEHDTGIVPLGSDPEHCRRCRCAAAGHGEPVREALTDWTGQLVSEWTTCGTCGTRIEERL